MKKTPSLAIIIPMYNEELGAQKCIDQILQTIKSINHPIQLVIVNDGSSDKTEKILLSAEKIHKKTMKAAQREINTHLENLQQDINNLTLFCKEVTSLNKLKPYLQRRWEHFNEERW